LRLKDVNIAYLNNVLTNVLKLKHNGIFGAPGEFHHPGLGLGLGLRFRVTVRVRVRVGLGLGLGIGIGLWTGVVKFSGSADIF